MSDFLNRWSDAALTSAGFFWMAFWAFSLGYLISSLIQVFVTRERMQRTMGKSGIRSIGLATFFGFISSSCSFAALATAKSLFQKGAGIVPALAFLLASTNLVIELGILIAVFLSWQFVIGEYLGGVLLILFSWLLVRLFLPNSWVEQAREKLGDPAPAQQLDDWQDLVTSREGWIRVARQYWMEWGMVWRDVAFGFTVAGVIAAFVPATFFSMLFVGAGGEGDPGPLAVLLQTLVGPVAAFFTFIGSMGNIPLASLLYVNGVSFGGIMAFIFSDLVVFPVLRMNAEYYGWKMALAILATLFVALVLSSMVLHYSFDFLGLLPEQQMDAREVRPEERFALDYTLVLNALFLLVAGVFWWLDRRQDGESQSGNPDEGEAKDDQSSEGNDPDWSDRFLTFLAIASLAWVAGGLLLGLFV